MSEYDAITRALDDSKPTQSANRSAAVTDCRACGGDRFVPVDDPDREVYMRCPTCNPDPATARAPVATDAWWKT